MIYFARCAASGYVKIGLSNDVTLRMQTLTQQYGPMELLGVMDGGRGLEAALHMAFAMHLVENMGREWFHDNPALRRYIWNYAKLGKGSKPRILPDPPTYNQPLNCHLYDAIMKKRQEPGWRDLTLEDLAEETGMPLAELRRMYRNEADILNHRTMDALLDFFQCDVGDLLRLSSDFRKSPQRS